MTSTASHAPQVVEVSDLAAIGVFALIVFHLAVGWKLVRLSRAGSATVARTTATVAAT